MRISIDEARQLVVRVMVANAHSSEYAGIIADHIIDCELRGLEYGGLARVISIV
ncbi:MAG: Ldh family oxidoreductase, partial [Rhodospirillaceae bacterium]|nr:Ldh family oxidoreductase [Rhodospirillaceae bacterium]